MSVMHIPFTNKYEASGNFCECDVCIGTIVGQSESFVNAMYYNIPFTIKCEVIHFRSGNFCECDTHTPFLNFTGLVPIMNMCILF